MIGQHVGVQHVAVEHTGGGALDQLGLRPRQSHALDQVARREERAKYQRDEDLVLQAPLDERPRDDRRERPHDERDPREQRAATEDAARNEGAKVGDKGARAHAGAGV